MKHIVIITSKCIGGSPWTLARGAGYWVVLSKGKESVVPDEGVTDEWDFIRQIKEKVGKLRSEEDVERKLREEYRRFRPSHDRSDTHESEDYDS